MGAILGLYRQDVPEEDFEDASTPSSSPSFRTTDSGTIGDWAPQHGGHQHDDEHPSTDRRHTCLRCTVASQVLHNSATSAPVITADKLASTVQFLHRLDSANVHEIAGLLGVKCKPTLKTGRAVAALPPYEARQAFLEGPACPPCCPSRTETAEGINALRQVSSVDIESMLRLACKLFATDMAAVTMLTGDAYYVTHGTAQLSPGPAPTRWGFCGWSFLNSCHELLVVEDLKQDLRFSENWFVTDPDFQLRFYVGCPLVAADGHRLGTLCLVGKEPRNFDTTRGTVLANLAEMAVRHVEKSWALSEASQCSVSLMRSLACYEEAFLFLDTSRPGDWRVLHINKAAADMLGCDWSQECLSYLSGVAVKEAVEKKAMGAFCLKKGAAPAPDHEDVPLNSLLRLATGSMKARISRTYVIQNLTAAQDPHAPGKHYDLHLRQANAHLIAPTQALEIGAPSYCEPDHNYGNHYYIASLVPVDSRNQHFGAKASSASGQESGDPLEPGPALDSELSSAAESSSGAESRVRGEWSSRAEGSSQNSGPHSTLHAQTPESSSAQMQEALMQPKTSSGSSHGHTQSHSVLPATGPFEGLLLGALLGQGSFGRVYRGLWKGQLVGVKIVNSVKKLTLDAEGQPIEATLTKNLKHMGITRTLAHAWWVARDRGGTEGEKQCWIIMEYCDRGNLVDAVVKGWFRSTRSPSRGESDCRTVAVTAFEIASAMRFLHHRNITHGDLSGGNVMLTSCQVNPHQFSARVVDFGLSRRSTAAERVGENMYGTITHMAPEVMAGENSGKAGDVYSFGVLLWEMLTSSRAWAGLQHARIMCLVGMQQQSLAVPKDIPQALANMLSQCLATDPAARPTFVELSTSLQDYLQESRPFRVSAELKRSSTGAAKQEALSA